MHQVWRHCDCDECTVTVSVCCMFAAEHNVNAPCVTFDNTLCLSALRVGLMFVYKSVFRATVHGPCAHCACCEGWRRLCESDVRFVSSDICVPCILYSRTAHFPPTLNTYIKGKGRYLAEATTHVVLCSSCSLCVPCTSYSMTAHW